ncbi:ATP-binding cassette domain-containing protein, partial [Pseudomonas syringae]
MAVAPGSRVEVPEVGDVCGKGSNERLGREDVSRTLSESEIVGLRRRFGSGKATLLRSIAGLVVPTEGEVNFPRRLPGRAMSVGMVFQSVTLFPWLTVMENGDVGLEAQRGPAAVRRTRPVEAIYLVSLHGCVRRCPNDLSRGSRQRSAGASRMG